MFTPLPAKPSAARRSYAATALKRSGLTDGDAAMADAAGSGVGPDRGKRRRRAFEIAIPEKDTNMKPPQPSGSSSSSMRGGGSRLPVLRKLPSGDVKPYDRTYSKSPAHQSAERAAAKAAAEKGKTSGPKQVTLLRKFVQGRYDAERKFLNLENLRADPFWRENHIVPPDEPEATKDIGPVILKLAGELNPSVETLSFADNHFKSLRQLAYIGKYLPGLINLSLQNNKIATSKDITLLANRVAEPSKLREVIFVGNPFRNAAEAASNLSNYRIDVLRTFPNLKMLDQTPISKIEFDVPDLPKSNARAADTSAPSTFPVEMLPGVLSEETQALTAAFLNQFFTFFDKARPSLVLAYAPNATFSYQANTAVPSRARVKRYFIDMPNQKKLTWEGWVTGGSRNLTKIRSIESATKSLHSSVDEILKAFQILPKTAHDLQEAGTKFLVDAWLVEKAVSPEISPPNGAVLYVTVHGQFTELPSEGLRSFDRTFVLVPAAPGSKAASAGWQCVVLSDQLTVRNYSSAEAWTPGPLGVQTMENSETAKGPPPPPTAPVPTALPSAPNAVLHPLLAAVPEPQRTLVIQFQAQTGLNVQFAGQCLEANEWDPARALTNFNQLKPTIPPEAFSAQ